MPFLSEADQDQLKELFSAQIDRRVRLRVLTRPTSKLYVPGQRLCASCGEAEPFVRELATLSDKLEVVVHDVQAEPDLAEQYGIHGLLPAILIEPVTAQTIDDAGESTGQGAVRFLGLPAGYEFSDPDRRHRRCFHRQRQSLRNDPGRVAGTRTGPPPASVRDAHLTVLPPCGQVGPPDGATQSTHYRRRDRGQ